MRKIMHKRRILLLISLKSRNLSATFNVRDILLLKTFSTVTQIGGSDDFCVSMNFLSNCRLTFRVFCESISIRHFFSMSIQCTLRSNLHTLNFWMSKSKEADSNVNENANCYGILIELQHSTLS